MSLPMRDFLRWITFLVSTPVVFYAGWPFIAGAWRELRQRAPGMDTLIAGSTLLAWAASVVETVRGGPQVWYDAAVMFVFLLLVARLLEQRVRATASAQVDALARARPALRQPRDRRRQREAVAVGALRAGDIVRVAPGEPVPADALLLDADASFAEALLTGEATAGAASIRATSVFAGSLCGAQAARLQLTRSARRRGCRNSRLVEQAQAHRPPLARPRTASRAGSCSPWRGHHRGVHRLAPARSIARVRSRAGAAGDQLPVRAVAGGAGGAGRGARRAGPLGVLPLRADALARLARIDTVVFDKTGTLSSRRPHGWRVESFDGLCDAEALRIAAALERDSAHPLAAAFAAPAADTTIATGVVEHRGAGIEGVVDGRRWRLGLAGFAAATRHDDGALWLGDGTSRSARFTFDESARTDAAPRTRCAAQGSDRLQLLSGDGDVAVTPFRRAASASTRARAAVARRKARACARPAGAGPRGGDGRRRHQRRAGARRRGCVVRARRRQRRWPQRSRRPGAGSPTLLRMPQAIALARRTRAVIRQNLAWALGYNLLALPLAALGW
jgi:Cu2+-exporting ATPase